MALPTDNISPEQLWAEITARPRPARIVETPLKRADGSPVYCAVRLLTQAEALAAASEGEREATRIAKAEGKSDTPALYAASKGPADLRNSCAAVEILMRAARMPHDQNVPFFPSKGHLLGLLPDEIDILTGQYLMVQAELGPVIHALSDVEVEAWIEKLTTGGQKFLLPFLSWGVVSTLLTSLASRAENSSTSNFSPGSQPEGGSSPQPTETPEQSSSPAP
jgi:hypothetical protein